MPGMVAENSIVEHLVSLVEHEHLDLREIHVATLSKINDATGGADDDVDALLQRVDLRLVGTTAVDGEHTYALLASGALEVSGYLQAELAGRADDECLRATVVVHVDAL